MSAAAAVAAAPNNAPAKGGKKKLVLILAVVVLLLAAAGGGALFLMKKKAAAQAAEDGEDGEAVVASHGKAADKVAPPSYLPIDPFVVNLADKEADRYAQIGITFELEPTTNPDQVRGYMPAIRNAILLVLAGKSAADLLDRSGKEQLAEEIRREAARPMGWEAPKPKPVKAAKADAAAEDDEAEEKPKARRKPSVPNPIRHVHFSSFIVQ